ncbi:MAG: sulfatase-like hydrolase/transferase [Proteobacteria bacterium]|nr:sulfatase-like hydrolase/transferase [Pseudomonadota bacterium]
MAICMLSCGNGGQAPEPRQVKKVGESEEEKKTEPPKPQKPRTSNEISNDADSLEKIFDFVSHLSSGHLRSGGLLIDFGTPARHKHTLGDWKSGWRGDFLEGETTFTYMAGNAAHIFFDVLPPEIGGAKITLRARGVGSQKGRVYLNGEYAGSFELTASDFGHATIEVTEGLKQGQNQILIRCNRRSKAGDGGKAALAVDYVRVVSAAAIRGPAAASFDAVRFPDPTGEPNSLALSGGESLTYNLPIPFSARIQGEARTRTMGEKGRIEIVAALNNGKEILLSSRDVSDRTARLNLNLDELAGESASITLRVINGEVVLRGLGLFTPKKAAKAAPGTTRAKNLVLVLIDTLRADRLSIYNDQTRVRTDYLDRIGKESMVFERALAPENWTKPSVASLLSGLYPESHQTKDDTDKLPKSVVTASEHFLGLGFATAGFVANGYVSGKFGFRQGWGTWTNYVRERKANRARFVVNDAVDWLDAHPQEKPFFLYVHTIDPHVPYIPPRKYWSLYDSGPYQGPVKPSQTAKLLEKVKTGRLKLTSRDKIRLEALYDGEITYHDDQIVRLHDALARNGLLDNTLVVVTSDHGEEFFEHGRVGHGHSLYEELLHVPLMFRLPGAKPGEGVSSSAEVNLIDVLPTTCDILGVECPSNIEGRSLLPLLKGKARIGFPSVSFSDFLGGQRAARMGRYKVIYKGLSSALYDLKSDPKETQDLSDEQSVSLAVMRDALGGHLGRFITTHANNEEKKRVQHKGRKATIDPETKRQLRALGYMGEE